MTSTDLRVQRPLEPVRVPRQRRVQRPPGQQPGRLETSFGIGQDVGDGLVLDDRDGAAAALGERTGRRVLTGTGRF